MKTIFALAMMLNGCSAFASLDGRLVEYSNGREVVKSESSHVMLKEDAIMLPEALMTLELLAEDKSSRDCQILEINRLDENSFEILTRTHNSVQVLKIVSTETRLVEAIRAGGELSRAPIGPLERGMSESAGKSFKMLRLRTLAIRNAGGAVGAGDAYSVLQIHYVDTEMGPKILKLETEAFASEKGWTSGPRLLALGDIGGTCEPHRASSNMHHHPSAK